MPQGEIFWNPYRWVEVATQPLAYATPRYHHRFEGLSGYLTCELEALTPLLIGDGHGEFVCHPQRNRPYLPATSLKGAIRSLLELVGNAAVPFPRMNIDEAHKLDKARRVSGGRAELDVAARMFGYLHERKVFAGLVRFSDGELIGDAQVARWPSYAVTVGQPRPSHNSFYPDTARRKIYHHQPKAERLTAPHAGITQTVNVRPAPPGTVFRFTVEFQNLGDEEFNLLLYCLALEEEVTVRLSKEALGPNARQPVTVTGPMRHKIGGGKPHGGGSAQIRLTRLMLNTDAAARYRGRDASQTFEGVALQEELKRRIIPFTQRLDPTMQQLRAMMIYSADDPRRPVHYPLHQWFQEDRKLSNEQKHRLKPTL